MIKLSTTLRANALMSGAELAEVRRTLQRLGIYERQIDNTAPFVDDDLAASIKTYQQMRGLKADGVIKPGGETERDLNQFSKRFELTAKDRPTYRCKKCNAPHGGVVSPRICFDCWKKEQDEKNKDK